MSSKRGEKQPSIVTPAPVLNDESWSVNIYGLVTGESEDPEYLKQLYSTISSGLRGKFSVISRNDLITWALELGKTNEVTKEIKTLIDGGQTEEMIPDHLMAKMIKIRLFYLKQEGLDARAKALLPKEIEEVPQANEVDLSKKPKTADKEKEKKDDKKKDTPKKAGKGGKAPEPASRPESAIAPVEVSKRKEKIRARAVGKADVKIVAIDDEPVTGPSAYYALKDLNTPGIYNALMEEENISVDSILYLIDKPPTNNEKDTTNNEGSVEKDSTKKNKNVSKSTSSTMDPNTKWNKLRKIQKWSDDNSSWKQCCFVETLIDINAETKDIFDLLAKKIYQLLDRKKEYESLYEANTIIAVPLLENKKSTIYTGSGGSGGNVDLRQLQNILQLIPKESLISTDIYVGLLMEILYKMMSTETAGVGDSSTSENIPPSEEMGLLQFFFDKAMSKLATAKISESRIPSKRISSPGRSCDAGVFTVNTQDIHGMIEVQVSGLESFGIQPTELLGKIRSLFPMSSYFHQLEKLSFLPNGAVSSRIERERLMRRMRLANSLGGGMKLPDQIERATMITHLEKILDDCFKNDVTNVGNVKLWDLNEYNWSEALDKTTLLQVLEEAKIQQETVLSKYIHEEGYLLLAICGSGAPHSVSTVTSNTNVFNKVGFNLYNSIVDNHQETEISNNYKVTGNQTSDRPNSVKYAYSAGDHLYRIIEQQQDSYPSDGCHIKLKKTSTRGIEETPSDQVTSIDYKETHLQWGKIKKVSPYFTATFNDGTCFSLEKSSTTEITNAMASSAEGNLFEFLGNGNVLIKILSNNVAGRSSNTKKLNQLEVGRIITSEGNIIKYYDNDLVEILYPNGSITTKHEKITTSVNMNGDRIQTEDVNGTTVTQELTHFRVVHETITGHFITLREDMVKTTHNCTDNSKTTVFPDGTEYVITENPSCITIFHENLGKVILSPEKRTLVLPCGTIIEKSIKVDNSEVTYNIRNKLESLTISTKGTSMFSPRGVASDLREFDWVEGGLKYSDTQTRVNQETNHPRLFVLKPDGTGTEFVRDSVMKDYFETVALDTMSTKKEEPCGGNGNDTVVTIMTSGISKIRDNTFDHVQKYGVDANKIDLIVRRQILNFTPTDSETKQKIKMFLQSDKLITTGNNSNNMPTDFQEEPLSKTQQEIKQRVSSLINEPELTSANPKQFIFGENQQETESVIANIYDLRIRKKSILPIHNESLSSSLSYVPAITGFSRQGRKISICSLSKDLKNILHKRDIPKYFESPEGLTFLKQQERAGRSRQSHIEANTEASTEYQYTPGDDDEKCSADDNEYRAEEFYSGSYTGDEPKFQNTNIADSLEMLSGGIYPNKNYLRRDSPLHGHLATSSVANIKKKKSLYTIGAFQANPLELFFELDHRIKDTKPMIKKIVITNVGHIPTRFRIKKIAKSLLKVTHTLGPLAPGISVTLTVELILNNSSKDVCPEQCETIQVVTESEILIIRVFITIL